MSSRRVAELDDAAVTDKHEADIEPYAVLTIPVAFEQMRDFGLPVEDVTMSYRGVSLKNDGNTGHDIYKVETLEYPLDDPRCEATERVEMWVCTCGGWIHHHNEDFPKEKRPSQVDECPHTTKVKRKERQAVDDENQTELGGAADD